MSNLSPDKELPLTLRADRQLSLSPEAVARHGAIAQARPDRPLQSQDVIAGRSPAFNVLIDQAAAIGLGMTGIALVTGFGWFLERRRRIAGTDATDASATATATATAPARATDAVSATATDAANDAPNDAPNDAEPADYGHAPVPTRSRNSSAFLSVSRRKRLISLLLGMRLVAGAIAILGAIAVVVFWSIESTEQGPRDMGLTWNLLVVTFAGWVGHWGFGWLANRLHRATFNRVHPKFDT